MEEKQPQERSKKQKTVRFFVIVFICHIIGFAYIRQNEKCAFYKTKSATKFQKQQTPIAKVCCFF